MRTITREHFEERIANFAAGGLTLEQLRHWLTPILLGEEAEVQDVDSALAARLTFLIEDDSIDESRHRVNARRIKRLLEEVDDNLSVLEILSVVTDQDRLCEILQKYQNGIISRTSFLSMISNSRYQPDVKEWLIGVERESLQALSRALEGEDYGSAVGLLRQK
jgi:hypothetical protein